MSNVRGRLKTILHTHTVFMSFSFELSPDTYRFLICGNLNSWCKQSSDNIENSSEFRLFTYWWLVRGGLFVFLNAGPGT